MTPQLDAPKVVNVIQQAGRNATRKEILQITADEVRAAGSPYTSVYLYMLHGQELVLEAFAGRETEHVTIRVGHGVCGSAVSEGRDQNVGDVNASQNYIACNLFTKSELVVLIRQNDVVVGQIDVDSDVLNGFSKDEELALKSVAEAVGNLL